MSQAEQPDSGDTIFGAGEAETLVTCARNDLRQEQDLLGKGDPFGADAARARAQSQVGDILTRLKGRFVRYAYGAFGADPELVEDATQEMCETIWKRVRDLSGTYGIFERRFNFAVRLAVIDAIRKVRGHNELTVDGRPATHHIGSAKLEGSKWIPGVEDGSESNRRYTKVSLNSGAEQGGPDDDDVAAAIEPNDPLEEDPQDLVIDELERQRLGPRIAEVLTELTDRQRRILHDRIFSEPRVDWVETAFRVGLKPRQAQNEAREAFSYIRARLETWVSETTRVSEHAKGGDEKPHDSKGAGNGSGPDQADIPGAA